MVLGGLSAVGAFSTAAIAAAGEMDAIGGLASYGALGLISLWLLYRSRERDREMADERRAYAAERDAILLRASASQEAIVGKLHETKEVLIRIETTLKERGP